VQIKGFSQTVCELEEEVQGSRKWRRSEGDMRVVRVDWVFSESFWETNLDGGSCNLTHLSKLLFSD